MKTQTDIPAVYASQDVPGNFGFVGCDSDQYETREAAQQAAIESVLPAPNKAQHSDLVGSPHESPDTTRRQAKMNAIQTKHEESGCPDYLQHNAENCPCLIAEQYSDDQYDTEAIEIDARHGNFSEDRAEDYRHENIVRASLVNRQFTQARKQCESYGLNYELERYKFDHE